MAQSVQPIVVTADLERLLRFYSGLFDAPETGRTPPEGQAFYVGVRLGSGTLGLVSDAAAPDGPQRILLSVEVDDVDALLPRVEGLGGTVLGPPDDMPWGQRVAHLHDPDGNTLNLTHTS